MAVTKSEQSQLHIGNPMRYFQNKQPFTAIALKASERQHLRLFAKKMLLGFAADASCATLSRKLGSLILILKDETRPPTVTATRL